MDELISARYLWDVEAMTEALATHMRHSLRPIFRFLLILLMLFYAFLSLGIPTWIIVDSRSQPETRRNAAIALIVFLALWAWFIDVFRNKRGLRWRARLAFQSLPGGPQQVEWSLGPAELSNRTWNSATTFHWTAFLKVVESRNGFMLYQSAQFFNWIPGHAFASEFELRRFANLARARVPNYVVLGECQFPAKPEPIVVDEF
jgi:hypothetical protein